MTNFQPASILIVDDIPTNIKVLFNILIQSGFQVSVAKNGESALLKVQEALPDLILLDVLMPGIDGFETCRRLKADLKTQDIPVIFLTALDEVLDKVKAFEVGGVDYITKPYQAQEVLIRVQNQLTLQKAKAEVCQLNVELEQRVRQRTAQLEAVNQDLQREIAERKKIEEQLAWEKAHLLNAQQVAHVGSWEIDVVTQQIRWSDETFRIFGLESVQSPPTYLELQKYIHAEDRLLWEANINRAIAQGNPSEFEFRIVRLSGEVRYIFARARAMLNCTGQVTRLFGTVLDITEQHLASDALLKSEEQFRLTFELAPIGMVIKALDGKFVRVNQAFCETLGYTSFELLDRNWVDLIHPEDLATFLALKQDLRGGKISDFKIENRFLTKDGRLVYGILQLSLVRDSDGKPLHLIGQLMDITERKQVEEQLLHGSLHDPLTDLPNRTLLMERLELSHKRTKRHQNYLFALLFIDLDRFKVINDSLGHQVGDQLLVAVARKLEKLVRPTDTVARLGGDEFIILLEGIQSINDAIRIAQRLSYELKLPLQLKEREVFTNASIGIALSSSEYSRGADLLRDADIAMYRAKEKGKGRYEVFDSVMYTQALKQLQIENDLRQALERQELKLYYQPIFCLSTNKLTGFEALVRWHHPQRGVVSPADFIPIAEDTGLIVPIGEWVLHEACQQMNVWQAQFPSATPLNISVNLSLKQLKESDFLLKIDRILAQTGLNGEGLKLELTESMLMDNCEEFIAILSELRAKGIHLSIDDFGTGYSSLSYLHHFPVNNLKVDRSFVSRIGEQGNNRQIIQTIITLAHQLGMKAIAEGVETSIQLNQLQALNCDEAQGYLFSKPMSQDAAEALIAAQYNNPTFSHAPCISRIA